MTDIFQIVENNGTPKDIGDSKARANIGEPFSTSKSYAVGDECLYEGILYKFTSNHDAGSWNSSHVTSINLANDKVNKSGDTMTGDYSIKNLSMDSTITPATNILSNVRFKDKNNATVGVLRSGVNATGRVTIDVLAHRVVSNTDYYNSLSLCVNDDGTPYVYMQNPDVWRNALGLGDSGWKSLTNASVYSGTIYYRKVGSVIHIFGGAINLASNLSANSYITLGTLPSGYRPSKDIILSAFINTNLVNNKPIALRIITQGDIYLYSNNEAIATNYNIYLGGTGI